MRNLFKRPHSAYASALGVVLTGIVAASIVPARADVTRATPALVLVVPVMIAGLVGGRTPSLLTAVAAAAVFNLFFIEPYNTFKVDAFEDFVALAVFGGVAATVGTLVAREGERRQAAAERATELGLMNDELVALQAERERLAEDALRASVLERVDEQRSALLRSVSHDLRTPLSTIRAVATDLLSDPHYSSETRVELLGLVAGEAERLDRLVGNLLSLSRIEAGALQPDRQAVAMDELFDHTVKRLTRLFEGRRVQVEIPGDLPLVDGDFTQLEQVASNLLENAARHAPVGSTIRVGGKRAGPRVEIWVDDEGPGIATFERQRIFEPFRTGDGSNSSGIGLAICKAIVEAHGGTIDATTAASGGARFAVSLPARHD